MDAAFKEELIEWGVDWEDVHNRFMGNEDLIAKFMLRFLGDPSMTSLSKYLGEENVSEAFKAVNHVKE